MSINNLNLAMPNTASVGDLVVVGLITDQTIIVPTGWVSARSGNLGSFHYALDHKVMTSGDLNTIYTWDLGGSTVNCDYFILDIIGITGIDSGAINTYGSPGTTTIVAPSITTTANNDIVLNVWAAFGNVDMGNPTPPPANSLAFDSTSANISLFVQSFIQSTSGNTGDISVSLDIQSVAAGFTLSAKGSNIQVISLSSGGIG